MLHNVHLYGNLANKYGALHKFDFATAPQAVSALCANYNTFMNDFKDGHYQVIIGDKENGTQFTPEMHKMKLGHNKDLHIIPVVGGSKNSGGLKIVAGLAMLAPFAWEFGSLYFAAAEGAEAIGASVDLGAVFANAAGASLFSVGGFSVTYGNLAAVGLSLLVGGISQVITKSPQKQSSNSFLFNGAINQTAQGTAIPIVYGEFRVGSILVSSGLTIEQLM